MRNLAPGVVAALLLVAFGAGCKPEGGGGVAGSVVNIVQGGPRSTDLTLVIDESSISVQALTASSAMIYWETNVPATATVEYGETARYTKSTSEDAQLALRHTRELSGLKYNQTYHFRCVSTDAYKNLAQSADRVFTTKEQNFAPKAVTLQPPSNVAHDAVDLVWSVSEDIDFKSYIVRYAKGPDVTAASYEPPGAVITEKLRTTLRVTGLSPETPYWFRVFVRDTFEVETGSNIVSATTEVKYGTPDPPAFLAANPVTTTTLTLNWTRFTGRGFMDYRIYRSLYPGFKPGLTPEVTLTNAEATSWEDTGLAPNTTYYYKIFVRNQGGYMAASPEGAFRTYAVGERLYTVPDVYSPHDIVAVKSAFYIASYGALRIFDPAERAIVQEFDLPGYNGILARTADEERIFACTPTHEKVRVVNTATRRVIDEVAVSGRPQSVTLSRDETRLYVPSRDEMLLYVLDRSTLRRIAAIPTLAQPVHCAEAVNQPLLVVGHGGTSAVSLIHTGLLEGSGEIGVGMSPSFVAADAGGRTFYVLNRGASSVTRIDLVTGAVVDTLTVGPEPCDLAFAKNNTRLYLLCAGENAVRIYDLPAMAERGSFATGRAPAALALSRDEKTVYVVNYGDDSLTAHVVE